MLCVCLQKLRALENSLEKTQFKCKEAENIMTNYQKLKSQLQVSPTLILTCWPYCRSIVGIHRAEQHIVEIAMYVASF